MQTENSISKVYMWGSAECDQFLALDEDGEEQSEIKRPYLLEFFNSIHVVQISCGGLHTLFLTDIGKVYSSGCNDDGVLGRGEEGDPRIPGLVNLPPVNMICCGDVHSVAANSNGRVFFWGFYRNNNGPMGEKIKEPKEFHDFKGTIQKILSGNNHTLVMNQNKVYSCGDADTSVLGRTSQTRNKLNQSLKFQALGIRNVVDVFSAGYAAFIKRQMKHGFEYYAWGLNNYGQLGIGNTQNTSTPTQIVGFNNINIISMVGGEHHTLALDVDGNVYGFGRNDDGQIGVGEEINQKLKLEALKAKEEQKQANLLIKPKKSKKNANESALMGKQESDNVYGYEYITTPMKIEYLKDIKEIKATGFYSFAINKEGSAYSWGLGQNYVLGTRQEESVYIPKQIPNQFFKNEHLLQIALGGQHVVALTSEHSTYTYPTIDTALLIIESKHAKKTQGKSNSNMTQVKQTEQLSQQSNDGSCKRSVKDDKEQFTKNLKLD